jgi:hypothetical protein
VGITAAVRRTNKRMADDRSLAKIINEKLIKLYIIIHDLKHKNDKSGSIRLAVTDEQQAVTASNNSCSLIY